MDVEVVEVVVDAVTVDRIVDVMSVVTTAVTVDVLENVSVVAAAVVVTVTAVTTLEVAVTADPVEVTMGVEFSIIREMSGRRCSVVVDVGIGVVGDTLELWVKHWTDVTRL